MSIESRFYKLKYSLFMSIFNSEARVNLYVNSSDNLENAIKSKQIIKSKTKSPVYFTDLKYYSHPIFVSGRWEYYFEVGRHEVMIADLTDDFKKRLQPELIVSCTCDDFKLLKNIQVACKHIYRALFAFRDEKLINIQKKCYSNKFLLMRRDKIYVPHKKPQ